MLGDLSSATWLKTVSKTIYNGDHIDKTLSFFDTGTNDYTGIKYHYDQWERIRSTSSFAVVNSTETSLAPFTVQDYDWRGNVIATAMFEVEPNWQNILSSDNYATNTTTSRKMFIKCYYNDYEKLYKIENFKLNLDGSTDKYVRKDYFYDLLDREVASQVIGETAIENVYDSLGRLYQKRQVVSLAATKYNSGNFQYVLPKPQNSLSNMSGGGEGVLTISHKEFDSFGRDVAQYFLDLVSGQTDGIDFMSNNFVCRTMFVWHDNVGRMIVHADWGNGCDSWSNVVIPSRQENAPSTSSTTAIVTKYTYNESNVYDTIIRSDGSITKLKYDAIGRRTHVIEGYTNFNITNIQSGSNDSDKDKVTIFDYNGLDKILKMTAYNVETGTQITKYFYEDAVNASFRTSTIFPDSTDIDSLGSDQIKVTYNLDGRVNSSIDQNGTHKLFMYDNKRRLISEQVLTLGNGIDTRVKSQKITYNNSGAVHQVKCLGVNNSVINEIRFEYDNSGLPIKNYISNYGTVDVSTTPYISYSYEHDSNNGVLETRIRPSSITYPSGRIIDINYGDNNSLTDLLNEIASIREGTTDYVSYSYNGSGNISNVVYPQPNISLSVNASLDRFARIVDHNWTKNGVSKIHIKHSYDFVGNRIWRYDMINNENSERYIYDGLNRLNLMQRGILSSDFSNITSLNFQEAWDHDKLGNFKEYKQDVLGNGIWSPIQNRTHNPANEIISINSTPNFTEYDNNGNLTKGIKPENANANFILKYDAWNRLSSVFESDGETKIAEYEYNALNYRTIKRIYNSNNELIKTHEYFYNDKWQCIEERISSENTSEIITYIWGARYIDDLVCRQKESETLYALADPNWNILALCNTSGDVVERYKYDSYGKPTILDPDFIVKATSEFGWEYLYTTRQRDTETGYYYARNRYRGNDVWLTRDPAEYEDSISLYEYTFSSPINWLDPTGLTSWDYLPPDGDCDRNAWRLNWEAPAIAKRFGLNKFSVKSGIEEQRCNECCKDTGWHKTKTQVQLRITLVSETEFGSPTIPLFVAEARIGWYGRLNINGSGSASAGYCSSPEQKICFTPAGEAGFIASISTYVVKVDVGGRGGINVRVPICIKCTPGSCTFTVKYCLSFRVRLWGKVKTWWGWQIEYLEEWQWESDECRASGDSG
ncbi:MAG: hypothetical protein LBE12_09735 [Planctomycetaceae bacterium]|nr:hypothetical protein [Planctomycetaceae bacterium]